MPAPEGYPRLADSCNCCTPAWPSGGIIARMMSLGDEIQHHDLVKALAGSLRQRCGVVAGSRVIVAASGGCDSVALLRAIALLADRRAWALTLAVGHVQHHLRDEDGEQDARFVEQLAGSLDLPFMRADLDLRSDSRQGNLESAARRERYRALGEMARTFDASFIATAHHGDDQLETLLMRILRGASVTGLRGIAWRRKLGPTDDRPGIMVIRPMLKTDRAKAIAFLKLLNQPWQEDHTNADLTRLRARLRHDVLPVLRDISADAAGKAVELGDHLRHVHRLIETEVARHHEHIDNNSAARTIDRGEARLMNPVVLSALLRRLLTEAGCAADKLGLRALGPIIHAIGDIQGGQRSFALSDGVTVTLSRNEVRITVAP
jgi:tRNA(Ile)-lysidine synthase